MNQLTILVLYHWNHKRVQALTVGEGPTTNPSQFKLPIHNSPIAFVYLHQFYRKSKKINILSQRLQSFYHRSSILPMFNQNNISPIITLDKKNLSHITNYNKQLPRKMWIPWHRIIICDCNKTKDVKYRIILCVSLENLCFFLYNVKYIVHCKIRTKESAILASNTQPAKVLLILPKNL